VLSQYGVPANSAWQRAITVVTKWSGRILAARLKKNLAEEKDVFQLNVSIKPDKTKKKPTPTGPIEPISNSPGIGRILLVEWPSRTALAARNRSPVSEGRSTKEVNFRAVLTCEIRLMWTHHHDTRRVDLISFGHRVVEGSRSTPKIIFTLGKASVFSS